MRMHSGMMHSNGNSYAFVSDAGRFRDDPMEVESLSSDSGSGAGGGGLTPEPVPIEDVTTILTCGNCNQDVILSGKLLSEGVLLVPQSPVPHILGTNSIPSLHEAPSVHTYIHATSKAIAQLDWEIARLSAILQTLAMEREKLLNMVDEHKALLSPVRRLPLDLLSEIFIRCQRGAPCEVIPDVPDSFDRDTGPLLLTQVCQQWRDQALRTPELWTDIRIRIGRGELQESSRLPLVHAWLERSSDHPLRVCMTERQPRSPVYNSDSRNIAVGMLIGAARRWKKLYLSLHSLTTHWPLFQGLSGHIPNLDHCTITAPPGDVVTDTGIMPHEALTNLLSNAPLLTSLSLDYNIPILGLNLPRQTITYLDLYTITKERSIPVVMAFDTLSQCPRLTLFKVRCHAAVPNIPANSHLYQPSLQVLEIQIETDTGPGAESLLQHLTLPELSSLTLHVPEMEWDQETIMQFLKRSGHLKSLWLRCKKLEKRPLLQILEHTTQLTSLSLDIGLNITDDLLQDLSIPQNPSQPLLVPYLKYIELGGHLFIKESEFLSLITSRRYPPPPAQIQEVHVTPLEEISIACDGLVYGFLSQSLFEELDRLRWWGLRVQILCGSIVEYPVAT